MPFHFCTDELMLLLTCIPFVGALFARLHVWYHGKVKHKSHNKEHDHGKP